MNKKEDLINIVKKVLKDVTTNVSTYTCNKIAKEYILKYKDELLKNKIIRDTSSILMISNITIIKRNIYNINGIFSEYISILEEIKNREIENDNLIIDLEDEDDNDEDISLEDNWDNGGFNIFKNHRKLRIESLNKLLNYLEK